MYRIIRHYLGPVVPSEWGPRHASYTRTIAKGLTLEEAQAHCADPETSSSTCTSAAGRRRTKRHGRWFDGYTESK